MRITCDELLSDFHGAPASPQLQPSSPDPLPSHIMGNACGGSIFGGEVLKAERQCSAVGVSHERVEEPTAKTPVIGDRITRLAAILSFSAILLLIVSLACADQLFHGTIRVHCQVRYVLWTNVPAHVFVQQTSNLVDWEDIYEVRNIKGPHFSFGYPAQTSNDATFYRLRTP